MFPDKLNIFMLLHFTAMAGLMLYGIHRCWLMLWWYLERKKTLRENTNYGTVSLVTHYPYVTIQLPLYNERFVAARLMDAAAIIDWPKDRLEIQILDDSSDDTQRIVDERIDYWKKRGVTIKVLRRGTRTGFKAGALSYGLLSAKGEFVAVFDADFLPQQDFLMKTIPFFSDSKIGMVQAKWGFLNREHSLLTGIQSLLLGQHFSIEHFVRFRRGLFFNFNGTAGIWRRKAIESAGGWQSDTVTEDLDLSYRAQLAGWRFVYLDDLVVPSELPVTLASFRSQQQRWAKGSVQTARKILPGLFCADLPFKVKCESAAHLLANLCWLLAAVVTLTLYSTITWRVFIGPFQMIRLDLPLFLGTSFILFLYFIIYSMKEWRQTPYLWLVFLPVLTIGIAPSIAISVIKGCISRGGDFKRTPKFGIQGKQNMPGKSFLYRQRSIPYIVMNSLLFFYSLLPVAFVVQRGTWLALPFILLFPCAFLFVAGRDVMELGKTLE